MDESLYPALAKEHKLTSASLPQGFIYEEGGAIENELDVPLRDIEGTAEHFRTFVKGAATNTTAAQLKKDLVSAKTPIVVNLVDNSTELSKEEADAFEYAAKTFRTQMKFQIIQEEFLITASEIFGISENSFVVFMPGYWGGKGQKEHYYSAPFATAEETIAWVNANKLPLVSVKNPMSANVFKGDTRPVLSYYTLNKNKKKILQPFTDILRDVAKNYPSVSFTVDSRTLLTSRYAGHADTPKDGHVICLTKMVHAEGRGEYSEVFPYYGAFEAEPIGAFVQDFLDGKLKPFVQSEEAFPTAEEGKVQEVSASTYNDLVLADGYNSVLVLCENLIVGCSTLRDYVDLVAGEVNGSDSSAAADAAKESGKAQVKFFWMSPSSNNVGEKSLHPMGLPALYFFKEGNKDSPSEYKGDFNVDAIHSFIVGYTELQFFDDDDDDDDEF